ncbi:MAG: FKBP-type peptidyl-prolyl cis-trans isomerase [Candidatus Taylorbacteria bacterium]|nr:FKBP-type peptidyl-prolyl cis-trans isomerase [Candidatus Taylorbacteria bacterium]
MSKLKIDEGVAIGVTLVAVFGLLFFGNFIFQFMKGDSTTAKKTDVQSASVADAEASATLSGTVTGLVMQDVVAGEGEDVKVGNTISVHYRGKLLDGAEFDNSYDRGEPITFTVGNGDLIRGFDQGVVGMRVGGKRVITIPPEMAYGAQAVGGIPANATLVFEVELVEVKK